MTAAPHPAPARTTPSTPSAPSTPSTPPDAALSPAVARWTVAGAVAAGALLLLFPALRPWPDESVPTLALAAGFASDRWVVAHLCGIAGLGLLAPTLLGVRSLLRGRPGARAATAAVVTAWAGAGLSALYFGAEIFGIRTLAQAALRTGDTALLADVDVLREQPAAMTLFGLGLALVAAGGVLAAVALWRGGAAPRWSGVVLAGGLVLYLPQFFGTPAVRVGHGALMAVGLGLVAWAAHRLAARD
ncbi:hypothetical protein [Isoptericola sp. NPDC057653]|uniref:hypothetical protein n=1 Tax=Isoptericola sp. NPDC057653 TaxID=3346195 RepID=UPI0036C020D5